MKGGNAFIPETLIYFVDPFETACNQSLQIQFRGYPQIKIHAQGIVMGLKGACHGAACLWLHHGGFHFQEISFFHKATYKLNDAAPPGKDLLSMRINNQIEVTLTVFCLYICKAMPLLRQGSYRL